MLLKRIALFLLVFSPISSFGQVTIAMEKDGGVYKVPCKVNGLRLKFIFDTGASTVSISSSVANMMLENDYLSRSDIRGSGHSQIADGNIVDHTKINLKTIEIGELILHNVEAVVIHQQTAPLLLGQSAIQKIGKVTISGNNLIISSHNTTNPYNKRTSNYTATEIEELYKEGLGLYSEGNYLLAADKLDIVYKQGAMSLSDILSYARCLSDPSVERYEESLDVLLQNEEAVISGAFSPKNRYYYNICKSAYNAHQYNLCIKYGQLTKSHITFPTPEKWQPSLWIAYSYDETGRNQQAFQEAFSFLTDYLKYMEISALDCWEKEYRDPLVGEVYYVIGWLSGETYGDGKKYYIISAAWGDNDAIEVCSKCGWNYDEKPNNYVY